MAKKSWKDVTEDEKMNMKQFVIDNLTYTADLSRLVA